MFALDSNCDEQCCQVVVDSVENCSQQGNYIVGMGDTSFFKSIRYGYDTKDF